MDFIKRRLSTTIDPDKDQEEKVPETTEPSARSTILESISTKRNALWNDLTSKMKSDKTSPSSTEGPSKNGLDFMNTVRQKLQNVKLYENTDTDSDEENDKRRGPRNVEVAPLIDTGDNSSAGADDTATLGDVEEEGEASSSTSLVNKRKQLKKRDSFTAEEIYLDTVAAKVRAGEVAPDPHTVLVSPSRAVKEFEFRPKDSSSKNKKKASSNKLDVPNGNLINFDSMQNLHKAVEQVETIVHREDELEDYVDYSR